LRRNARQFKVAGRLLVETAPARPSQSYGINRGLILIMASTLTQSEEAQLAQTIEMFEVITQSQAHDYQSLEILKEAYSKLGREKDVIGSPSELPELTCRWGSFLRPFSSMKPSCKRYPDDADVQQHCSRSRARPTTLPPAHAR